VRFGIKNTGVSPARCRSATTCVRRSSAAEQGTDLKEEAIERKASVDEAVLG